MKNMRRKEKEIKDKQEIFEILKKAKFVTIAMCKGNEPYLVTLSHGFDSERERIYFHCAQEGKKVDILKSNNIVWGQAFIDKGYVDGKCDHLYKSVHLKGTVSFVDDIEEKRHALITMIKQLDKNPDEIIAKQITEKSLKRVNIGRIDISYLSGKKSEKVIISM